MADLDDDYEDAYYYDDDYVYVDDSFDLADELAENAIPEPPFVDRKEEDWDDFDTYDFWMDIEYNTDEYYDALLQRTKAVPAQHIGQKRKGQRQTDARSNGKRRKISAANGSHIEDTAITLIAPIMWSPLSSTHTVRETPLPSRNRESYALFPDWRDRFRNATSFLGGHSIPYVMEAKQLKDEAQRFHDMRDLDRGKDLRDNDGEDEDDGDEEAEIEEEDFEVSDAMPAQLLSILQQRLSASGMDHRQQASFIETIMSTLSKGGGHRLDDILEELTGNIVEQATHGGSQSGAAQWLSEQGVAMEDEGEEESEDVLEANDARSAAADSPRQATHDNSTLSTTKSHHDVSTDLPSTTKAQPDGRMEAEDRPEESVALSSDQSKTPNQTKDMKTADRKTEKKATQSRSAASKTSDSHGASKATSKSPESSNNKKRKMEKEMSQPTDYKPKRQARNFSAPTASSANKAVEPIKKTTRSNRQSKK